MTETKTTKGEKPLFETDAIISWWAGLHGVSREGDAYVQTGPGDSGTRARLRREGTVNGALLDPSVQRLLSEVVSRAVAAGGKPLTQQDVYRRGVQIAILAPTLARVKPGTPTKIPLASALGRTDEGKVPGTDDRPRLSRDRFAILVRAMSDTGDPTRLMTSLRRSVEKIAGTPFDVPALIKDVYYARGDVGAEKKAREWTFAYYQSASTDAPTERT